MCALRAGQVMRSSIKAGQVVRSEGWAGYIVFLAAGWLWCKGQDTDRLCVLARRLCDLVSGHIVCSGGLDKLLSPWEEDRYCSVPLGTGQVL